MFNPAVNQMLAHFERERLERNLARAAQAREAGQTLARQAPADGAGVRLWLGRARDAAIDRFPVHRNASQPVCGADGAC